MDEQDRMYLEDLAIQATDREEVSAIGLTGEPSTDETPEIELEASEDQDSGRGFKRLLAIGDLHCGHEVGLTPDNWNPSFGPDDVMHDYRAYMHSQFASAVDAIRPIDIAVINGDLIDGRGERSGSTELIYVDRFKQAKMAVSIIQGLAVPSVYITRGTDYHVGSAENWEDVIASYVAERHDGDARKRYGDVINIRISGGPIFNFRHHIGGSQTPVGRATPILKETVWNDLWHAQQDFPKADVMCRSHVHYALALDQPGRLAMTLPGLQGYGTRYGERRLSGIIHAGIVWFDIYDNGEITWGRKIFKFPTPPVAEE